jgi:hydrogenase nickel incorporation protein HypB
MTTRLLEIRAGVLSKNDHLAAALRERFHAAGVLALNLVSSPGTGKTAFLEHTLRELVAIGQRTATLVGDLETDNDARRLARSGGLVRQIETHGYCHLEAEWIGEHIAAADWNLNDLDYFFIENVGNLVCPSSYDLGEQIRVVLLSATEGEDKPLKYPGLFNSADVAVITKIDLAEPCEFNAELAQANIHAVHPAIPIFQTSAKTGAGMDAWLAWLTAQRARLVGAQAGTEVTSVRADS